MQPCSPPHGCTAPEVCNDVTGGCQPPVCNGVPCREGQDCIDPDSGARFTANAFCTCVTYQMAADGGVVPDSDSCLGYGKVCDAASAGPANGEPWTQADCK